MQIVISVKIYLYALNKFALKEDELCGRARNPFNFFFFFWSRQIIYLHSPNISRFLAHNLSCKQHVIYLHPWRIKNSRVCCLKLLPNIMKIFFVHFSNNFLILLKVISFMISAPRILALYKKIYNFCPVLVNLVLELEWQRSKSMYPTLPAL